MPTVFSHPAPVLALAALLSGRVSTRMLLFGILCAVLPDADVIGFRFGISYADAFGHRGFSHSFVFALLMGCIGFGVSPLFLRGSRLMGFTVGFLAVSSHILLDAMTNGGLGVAALWPFDQTRYFCDWRPIRVSPFGLKALLSQRGLAAMLSELTPIPLWRISQNGIMLIAMITCGTLSIRKLNAIKRGCPIRSIPDQPPCRDYR